MPSIQDSINSIKAELLDHDHARQSHEQTQREHEDILDEYDRMTRRRSRRMREANDKRRSTSPPSMRFRFKHGKSSAGSSTRNKSKHSSRRSSHRHTSRRADDHDPSISASPQPEPNVAQPGDPDAAFRESLFDAMADDEGAAYWEGVYGDSIHSYPRPSVKDDQGRLEKMTDDQYVEYVKAKMWEKKNPDLLRERRAREDAQKHSSKRKHCDSEDEEYEEDFEWVGNEEIGYEKRSTRTRRSKPHIHGRHDNSFMSDVDAALARGAKRRESKRWQQAWSSYQQRWQTIKASSTQLDVDVLLRTIPWPVDTLDAKDISRQNVEKFFSNAPLDTDETRVKTLKDESINWHPDRFQRRFGGSNVDEETLKLATSVFQTIYDMWDRMR